ncbi:MAG: maleylpyruvate isomerase family mycothiol-dependent enzyme [Acidimicrobiia bacterium]
MTDDQLQSLVAADFMTLADRLEALPPDRWDVPSLCELWRVREVVAHMTMPARYNEEAFMAELRDCEFDFTRVSNKVASRDAQLPTAELLGNLRDEVLHRWQPPVGGVQGALNHVVIHALDVTVPLGEPRCSPDATMRIALDALTASGGHAYFGTDIEGLALEATDIDWSYGAGSPVRGSAANLALMMCGRNVPVERG